MQFSSGNNSHFGLKTIFVTLKDKEILGDKNVVTIVKQALPTYEENSKQIKDLKAIYSGNQAILNRTNDKTTVNEKVNLNIIPTVVDTIAGLYLGEKIDYVYSSPTETDEKTIKQKQADVAVINRYMRYCGDILCDKNALTEMLITGVAYQFCGGNEDKNRPFLLTSLPSENCFTIHTNKIGYPIIANCVVSNYTLTNKVSGDSKEVKTILVYTNDKKYTLSNNNDKNELKLTKTEKHYCSTNPIQLIKLNQFALSLVARLESAQNAFNVAVSDSINATIEQIRSLLAIYNAEITKDEAKDIKETGILNLVAPDGRNISAEYITKPLDENINRLRQFLFDIILFIAGVPTENTGGSGNNGAVAMASGFFGANIDAYFNELEFQLPKQNQIDIVIDALSRRKLIKSNISSFEIEVRFDRNKLTSLKENADALAVLLANHIPTRDALKVTGIFGDVDRIANEMDKVEQEILNTAVDTVVEEKVIENGVEENK